MMEYNTIDIKCYIDWKDSEADISREFDGYPETESVFDAEIRYDYRKPALIELFIFYPQSNYLFEKFEYLNNYGKNIFPFIQILHSGQPWEYPELLDFSNSELLEIVEDHSGWKYGKKPVVIRLKNLTHYTSMGYADDGFFYLTENACLPFSSYSKYLQDDNILISDKPVNNGTYNKLFDWGKMSFGLGFKHWVSGTNKHEIKIERIPYLKIAAEQTYTDAQIIEYANSICLMMSLFWSKNIDFYHGVVRVNIEIEGLKLKERTEFRYIENQVDDNVYNLWGDYEHFFAFIDNIVYDKVISCNKLVTEISNRVIKSQYVDSTSEFMLLYNVIEKIRNYYLDLGKNEEGGLTIKEEFNFNLSGKKRDKHIKKVLKGITPIVSAEDKLFYLATVGDKVSFIRKTGLKDQFDSLVTYLELSPEDYQINFIELVNIRNRLYHGSHTDVNLKPYIEGMRKLICDLLLKMLGS